VKAAAAAGVLLAACLLGTPAAAQTRDWAFIQSVGGLKLGVPVDRSGMWWLPVRCNVSGAEAVTAEPTAFHPTLACATAATVEGRSIVLTIMARPDPSGGMADCPPARLGILERGRYTVFYSGSASERVEIGDVYLVAR
jgi:hypothetical protein